MARIRRVCSDLVAERRDEIVVQATVMLTSGIS